MVDTVTTAEVTQARRAYHFAAARARVASGADRARLVRDAADAEQRWAERAARLAD